MGPYVTLNAVLIGFFGFAATYHFVLWLQSHRQAVLLAFAIHCLLCSAVSANVLALVTAQTLREGQRAVDVRLDVALLSQISAIWVLSLLSGVRAKRFVWFMTAAFLAATVANVAILPLAGTVTGVEQVSTSWGEQIAALHREGQSRWFVVFYALAFSVHIFGFVCAKHLWSRDRIGGGLLAVASCAIIVGLLNAARIDAAGSQGLYLYVGALPYQVWALLFAMLSILPGVHRVDTAATSSDARQRLEAAPPDVVVLDVHLPGGSGIEVLDALRPVRDRVTVIVLTNDPTPQGRDTYQRAGADFFFDKSAEFQRPVDIIAGLALSRISLSNQLLLTEEALRASETRCRELFDNATDAMFTTDLDLNFTALNGAAEALIGYTREEAIGLNVASIVSRETLEQAQRKLADQWGGKAPSLYETEILARDGRRVPVEVIARLVSREGKPIGIQGIARDISDRKRLEQGLLQAHKMEAVGRLAGGIAHDFNNLLTVIVGFSQDIIERLPPDDPTHADAVQIFNAGGYAVDLTRQLLAFSRKQVLAPRVLDLNAVIGQLAPMLRRLIGADVEIVIRAAQDLGAVKADRGQLEQVIVNLFVNARDAMPHGGTLTVETSTAVLDASAAAERPGLVPGDYILLTIADTGSGMDPLTKAQIFDPFFTTKEAGQGTGLGLCTVYGIVKQSGGYIFVDSEPGQGTAFRLYFPRRPAGEIEPAPTVPALPREEGGAESILLVDDDRGVCLFTERVLTARGYTVLSATSPVEALQLCDRHPGAIDLLLTDVVMPGMTGMALADGLRARYPGMKVIYMSGYANDAIKQGVLDPLAFIAKPFTMQDLTSKIREGLDTRNPPSPDRGDR